MADSFIDILNQILSTVWQALPGSLQSILQDTFETGLGVSTTNDGVQANPADGTVWLMLLVLVIAVAGIVSRSSLPNYGAGQGYAVRPTGSLLGGLLGGLNGLIIVNLVREYLDGRNLPGRRSGFAHRNGSRRRQRRALCFVRGLPLKRPTCHPLPFWIASCRG